MRVVRRGVLAMNNFDCRVRIVEVMENFLMYLARVGGNADIDSIRAELRNCGSLAEPYLTVIDGNEPSDTLSAAVSYYQYVKYVRGELNVNEGYFRGLDLELSNPAETYSAIISNLVRALQVGDYVSASFLADLAFVVRVFMLCLSNARDYGYCDRLRSSYKTRLLILRSRFSSSRSV